MTVHVTGEVLDSWRVRAYRHLTIVAPVCRSGSAPAPSSAVTPADSPTWPAGRTGSTGSARWAGTARRSSSSSTPPGRRQLAGRAAGGRAAAGHRIGRPFALPKEPVSCVLVGRWAAAPLFPLAERLRERGCSVTLVVAARDEAHLLLSALEARRSARAVSVVTGTARSGSGPGADVLADTLVRAGAGS